MIIRRHYTRNFTVMNREVFQDERLSVEALGVLCYLRHLPDNWTVSQDHLRKRFQVGKDKMQRIIRELIDTGWMVRQTARADGRGTFAGSDYVVNDEPAKASPQPDFQAAAPQPDLPEPGFPEPAEPAPEKPAAYLDSSLPSRDSTPLYPPAGGKGFARKLLRGNGISAPIAPMPAANGPPRPALDPPAADRFGRLWAAYPEAGRLHADRRRAERYFAGLTEADQLHAVRAAGAYVAELAKSKLAAKALHTWLRNRRFTNFPVAPAAANAPADRVFVREGSPEWEAWEHHLRSAGRPMMPASRSDTHRADGWWFPSLLPPASAAA